MTPLPSSLAGFRIRALALACGVIIVCLAFTEYLARFIEKHVVTELRNELHQDGLEIRRQLEREMSERVTVLRQAVSFWLFSEEVSREEFRGYAGRLLSQKQELFFNLSYSGPDFKLRWAEPETLTRNVIGLDHSIDPYRYPHMTPQEIRDEVVIGGVYRLKAADREGFCIIAPIFYGTRFEGFITGTVVLEALFRDVISPAKLLDRHVTVRDSRGQGKILFNAGVEVPPGTLEERIRFTLENLEWDLEIWAQPLEKGLLNTPHHLIRLVGVLAALILGSALGGLWYGKQRIRSSEGSLRQHAAELEQANRRLAGANHQLEEANDQLEEANDQLKEAKLGNEYTIQELERANSRLEATNSRLGAVNEELATANTQLRDLNKELDDFNHVVSHDLKEPLRGIQAFSQFLLEDYADKLDEFGRSYLENLMSSASRMQQLINDLMQLARVTKTRATHQVVNMNHVLENAIQDLAYTIRVKDALLDIPKDLPEIWGDPTHLLILVKNLISNGLKYNNKPAPRLTVRWTASDNMVEFRFQDNGIGIDPRYHKKIFELFERLVVQEEYEGTGAGLAISKKIIEQHGGVIWVESTPGQGSTFVFTLPRADAREIETVEQPAH